MSIVVQLPDTAQSFVDEQVASGRFTSPSEFIANLVEQARRQAAHERVEKLLLEGLDSGPGIEVTPEFWQKKKGEWTQKYGRPDKP
jgi:antitoxin ParD1/3/4